MKEEREKVGQREGCLSSCTQAAGQDDVGYQQGKAEDCADHKHTQEQVLLAETFPLPCSRSWLLIAGLSEKEGERNVPVVVNNLASQCRLAGILAVVPVPVTSIPFTGCWPLDGRSCQASTFHCFPAAAIV